MGDAAPPVFESASMVAKNTHTYLRSTSRVFSRTKTMGRIIMTAVMLFRQEEMRNIIPPNIIRHSRFRPLESSAILMASSCMMPVSTIRFVKSSITIRIARTS